jgi:hypothetical protein
MWIESSSGGFVIAQQEMKLGEGGKNKAKSVIYGLVKVIARPNPDV